MFENVLSWFLTGLKFLLSIHYLACGWIVINLVKELEEIKRVEFVETTVPARYFESFYLITTTITTVGYGDYKAYNDSDPVWATEMLYLFFVSVAGTLLFSTVTNSVFNYQKLDTVNEIVSKKTGDMEVYLYDISRLRKDKFLGDDKISESLEHMEEYVRNSTRFHFEENNFYKDLPTILKRKLTMAVLYKQREIFEFFF